MYQRDIKLAIFCWNLRGNQLFMFDPGNAIRFSVFKPWYSFQHFGKCAKITSRSKNLLKFSKNIPHVHSAKIIFTLTRKVDLFRIFHLAANMRVAH